MADEKQIQPDVVVSNHGSLFTFEPLTDAAKEWINNNVDDEAQFFGNALCVEHRYARDLAQGMIDAGLVLQ